MSRNYSIFIVLWILVQLLVKVDCQTETFIPIQRILHTATFIDKLYILGGYNVTQSDDGGEIIGKQFFVNDTSVTFEFPQWKDLTNINIIPAHVGAASVKGVDNKTLILYGGRTFEKNENMNSVYMFDTLNNTWSTYEETYPHKRSLSALIDSNGKMYLFGGRENNGEIVNNMLILDTVNLSWSEGSSLNAPCARINYGAIILPNQSIVYLGGMMSDNSSCSLSEVYLYDTINDQWDTKQTSGTLPSDRHGFSAVLGLDGQQLIIFGGRNQTNEQFNRIDSLYTLNLSNFMWNIPKVSGDIPSSRSYHRANVIDKYMVISFGSGKITNDLFLLDISNNKEYKWIEPNKDHKTNSVMIGIIMCITLLSIGFFMYKKLKRE